MFHSSYRKDLKFLVASIATFVLTVAGAVWFYHLVSLQLTEYTEQVQLLVDAEAVDQTTAALANDLEASVTERAELENYILDVVQIAQFLETVERYAAQKNLTIASNSLRTQEPDTVDASAVATVAVPYVLQGERSAVIEFLELMETLPYHSQIQSVRLRSTGANATELEADVTVVISYLNND